jgi:NitT/TauT family transport system ATP-binding protein
MGFNCQALSKSYRTRTRTIRALEETTFSVKEQEFVCVVGPSGCGKTTLLKLIAGLLTPTSGRIVFGDGLENGWPRNAMVFQEHGLFPWMTVLDNVAFGLETRGLGRRERRTQARGFVQQVGLGPFADCYPHVLSVGMRQRVGIARAFLTNPQLLLMDEPLGSVDAQTKRVLQEELLRLWQEHPKTVIYVTHDIEEAVLLGDRVLVMSGRPGRIREEISVPYGRPRRLEQDRSDAQGIKQHIWQMLEEEARQSLCIPV